MSINLNDNVGKMMLALDFENTGISPCLEVILDHSVDPKKITAQLNLEFKALLAKHIPGYQPTSKECPRFEIHAKTGIIKTQEERVRAWEDAVSRCQYAKETATHEPNPDDGKIGYWLVSGIRHSALVWAASSADAMEKAKPDVGDWEQMAASFMGERPEKVAF